MGELLGTVVGKALMLAGMVTAFAIFAFFARVPDQMDAGDQLQRYADQAKVWMTANFSTGGACGLPAGGLVAATAGGVQEYGSACIGMPATWRNQNVYGQSHTLKVFQPNPGANPAVLYGLVQTCGGDTLTDTEAAKAAAQAKPDGGFLPSGSSSFTSAGGKWAVAAGSFNTAACPNAAGHLAAFVVLDGAQVVPPFMHRYAVGGSTEPNTMRTTMRMGANPIVDASDVQLSNSKWLSSAIMDADIAQDGAVVTKPTCPHGTPRIILAQSIASGPSSGLPLVGFQPYVTDNGGTWTVHVPVYTINSSGTGTTSAGSGNHAQVAYFLKCT
jgi:hypothetical protein